jgi:ketosteroid isomerase-like protein
MYRLVLVVLAAVVASAAPAAAQGDIAAAEKEVRKVIADYNAAYGRNDLDSYFSYFAPDLTQWFPSGRVDLKSYRESWTKSVKEGNVLEQAEVLDLQVQISPAADAGVATYILRVTEKNPKREVRTSDNHETDVLFKRDGAWKIVHVNYSPARSRRPPTQ